MENNVYIYYSGATDITGEALKKALDIDGGKKYPKDKALVIGWGAKIKQDVTFSDTTSILNHPNAIRKSRDKLKSLQVFTDNGVSIAPFYEIDTIKDIVYPVIGRTKYHQGGNNFWLCLNKTQLDAAIQDGVHYFQQCINIKDEFRLHIFNEALIFAQKKVKKNDPKSSYITAMSEKVQNAALKKDVFIHEKTLQFVLQKLSKEHKHADMLIRSNNRGWKFIRTHAINGHLQDESVKALKALNLNFGAIDCCIDEQDRPYIIEVNSGPGLDGLALQKYIDTFKSEVSAVMEARQKKDSKSKLLDKLKVIQALAEHADGEEADVLNNLIKKTFG